jgi:hypothetical protein
VAEGAEPHEVVRSQSGDELLGRRAQQRQVALHAPRDVEHHDQTDWLRAVVEHGNRLRAPLVADFEVLAREIGNQPPVTIGDCDEDADCVAPAAEDGLLGGNTEHPEKAGSKRPEYEKPGHVNSIGRRASHLHS